MKSAILALCVIVALGVASTPDYVVSLEQENDALRAEVAALTAERVRADACADSGLVAARLMIARGE